MVQFRVRSLIPSKATLRRQYSNPAIDSSPQAASSLWELGDKLSSVLRQRRDTPDNEKWSGRWESNPQGRRFRTLKTSGLALWPMRSVISV
jgi:hypothetical protein